MVLNTGSGSSDYIDTSKYQNISLIGKAEITLDIELHWMDDDSGTGYVDLGVDLGTSWEEIGPIDVQTLSSRWDDKDVMKIWLEFSSGSHSTATDVRIGWIKLTE